MSPEPPIPGLGEEILRYLTAEGEVVEFAADDPIIRRGESGNAFFVVLSGKVEVRLTGAGDRAVSLRQLEAGAFFGEMSILTGDPVSADVVAAEPATLLSCPQELFARAMAECSPLRDRVMASMASNLRGSTTDVWNLKQRVEALGGLLDSGARSGPLVALSAKMRAVESRLAPLAGRRDPLLIQGDAGTGKLFIAHKIHESGDDPEAPFIVVDCRELAESEARDALVGSSCDGSRTHDSASDSLHQYGAIHLANRGTLVLRNPDCLPEPAQTAVADYLEGRRSGEIDYPVARIIATTRLSPMAMAESSQVDPRLARYLSDLVLALPTLRERRHDILALAEQFLDESQGEDHPAISKAAEHVLVSRRYQHGNVAELREAVDLAALIAGEGEILAEHIFTGPKQEGSPLEYDLGQVPLIGWLISDRMLAMSRWLMFAVFAAVIAVCLLAGDTAIGRFSNPLIWGVWWPVLIISFLLIGRLWCAVCPLSTAAVGSRRLLHYDLSPGGWLKKGSPWLISAGFLLVVWFEQVFHLTSTPFGAGILLLCLTAAAATFGVVYRREAWCRYLCPIGNLGAVYALPATVSVRANPSVCATCCTTHECHRGSENQTGCPGSPTPSMPATGTCANSASTA